MRGGGISFLIMFGIFWWVIPSYFFIIKQCSFQCDSLLAPMIRDSLQSFIKNYCLNKPFQLLELSAIQQQFPYVRQIDARYDSFGKFTCFCKVVRPHILINNKYLLMDDGSIHQRDYYTPHICKALPSITYTHDTPESLSAQSIACLSKIPSDLFERFSLFWVDQTSIYLQDKITPALIMRTDIYSILDDRLLNKYETIKTEIVGQRNYEKKQWVLDMRFKNQVVIAQKGMEGV